MLGAITGDVIGSAYEFNNTKTKDFDLFPRNARFTDDSVLTIAVADAILEPRRYAQINYVAKLKEYGIRYPKAGYGGRFKAWLFSKNVAPYGSFGNGSAMRVSPVAYIHGSLDKVLEEARLSAEVTHNHLEGIKGAQAVAGAIFKARERRTKDEIRSFIVDTFGYNLDRTLDQIRPTYQFDSSCQGSVPEAIIAFLESETFEETIRNAVSIGGDSDTIACIAGSIAEPYYDGVPYELGQAAMGKLEKPLRDVVERFRQKYCK